MLTLIEKLDKIAKSGHRVGLFKCECGNIKELKIALVKCGSVKSCGLCKTAVTTHGMSDLLEYNIWSGIKSRCYNQKRDKYERYGGRGITVCQLWLYSFEEFYRDMGPRPSEKHTIDRI